MVRSRLRVASLLLAALTAAVGLGACGGGSKKVEAHHLAVQRGLSGPQYGSAGSSDDYQPTGRIVADNGFRPGRDGFAFENYGAGVGAVDIDTEALIELFGPEVCVNGSAASCQVSPDAQKFAEQISAEAGHGHCYGFSVSALRFYKHVLNPSQYGAATVPQLKAEGNVPLQRLLAETWFTQMLDPVRNTSVAGTPNNVLDHLITELRRNDDPYTLAIAKRNPPYDGHAITPFAVEDKGGGRFAVLVYDNNFPLTTRAVMFDRNKDTWSYNGSPNPADPAGLYEGDARNHMNGTPDQPQLDLDSMRAGIGRVQCPFCSPVKAPGAARGFAQIALGSDAAHHAHLVITDAQGRKTGIVGGKLVLQIPGSQVIIPRENQDWRVGTEPLYRVPARSAVTVTVDGRSARGTQVDDVSIVGPGYFAALQGLQVKPGQRHRLTFAAGRPAVTYRPPPGATQRPVLSLGARVGRQAYATDLGAHQLAGGTALRAALDPQRRVLVVQTPRAAQGGTVYGLTVTRVTGGARQSVSQPNVQVQRGSRARLAFGALRQPEQRLPLVIQHGAGTRRTVVGG
jgi:hypothetical protein